MLRVLIFGTVHVDTIEKQFLVEQWDELHSELNPDCELMLIDANNSVRESLDNSIVYSFPDNIGHLSRGGQDGWGRAFCFGIHYAIENGFDYAVHIEGDSLCRLDVMRECLEMRQTNTLVAGVPVRGTKKCEKDWIESGLVFMDTRFLSAIEFIERYDWPNFSVKKYPHTPEWWLHDIFGDKFKTMHWKTIRDDCDKLNEATVSQYHWITHTKTSIYDAFMVYAK